MGHPLLTLFQKIKIVQAMHNVSDSDIRDCIGKDRYYNIEKEKADLPLETAIKFFELCNLSDTEKLWFLDKNATDYPVPKNILNEIRDLRSAVERRQAENKNPQPSRTPESSTQEKAGEKRTRVQPKKPHPS
jgi:hypothetical protein